MLRQINSVSSRVPLYFTRMCGMLSVGFFTEVKLQEHFTYKAVAEYVAKDEA